MSAKPKVKFKDRKIGKLVISLGKGILKEAVSYVPVVGDNLANIVEEKVAANVEVSSVQQEKVAEMSGKVLVGMVVLLLAFGVIDKETFEFILEQAD